MELRKTTVGYLANLPGGMQALERAHPLDSKGMIAQLGPNANSEKVGHNPIGQFAPIGYVAIAPNTLAEGARKLGGGWGDSRGLGGGDGKGGGPP